MPHAETVVIDVSGIQLGRAPDGPPVRLGSVRGVQILVLLRHRH